MNLPTLFLERMKPILKEEYDDFIKAFNEEQVKAFRVNTEKISLSDFEKVNVFGNKKIPYVDNGFYMEMDKAGNHPYHHAGMIYIQEPAAMIPAECIDINPNWKVLDMCAAPGGKSTQLKNKLGENGILVSNEINYGRAKILAGNIERLGLKNCIVTNKDSFALASMFESTFDLIMVDAPCSGEGMFRKDETAVEEWSLQNVELCAKRQKEILCNAAKCLKSGGYIIYSTCTYSLNENEMVVADFIKNHPDFEIVPVSEKLLKYTSDGISFDGCEIKDINLCRRAYPHINRGEGQFVAVLHNTNNFVSYNNTPKKKEKVNVQFLHELLEDFDSVGVINSGGNYYYLNSDIELNPKLTLMYGIFLGEEKKNYFLPSHQLFMAFGNKFKNKLNLNRDSDELKKYLHGEEITCDLPNGWAVVMVDGCSIGGVKVTNNIAKNHYPKGLRTLY